MRSLVNDERHYEVGTEKLPSVTTILAATQSDEKRESLNKWKARVGAVEADRIKNTAATRGTAMHTHLEKFLLGEGYLDLTTEGQASRTMADEIINKGLKNRLVEFWGLEVTLYYPELYAGATDVVGVYDGEESIVDFKQSNKPKRREWIEDYKLQLAGYALAHNEVYGTNIMKGVNLICTKDNLYQEFIFDGEEFKQAKYEFLKRVDQYYAQKNKENSG
jgi:genome maintenance exonuclease 1